jgi:hypothetical protein
MQVQFIEDVQQIGAYSPLTESGTLFVEDIHASCHSVVGEHNFVHAYITFVQRIHDLFVSFGSFGESDYSELPSYVRYALLLLEGVFPGNAYSLI